MTPREKAAYLFNRIKEKMKGMPIGVQMKIASVDDFDKLPEEAQGVFIHALVETDEAAS